MTEAFFILGGFLLGLSFLGGYYLFFLPVAAICIWWARLNRPSNSVILARKTDRIEKVVSPNPSGTRFDVEAEPGEHNEPFGHAARKKLREDVEAEVDACLYEAMIALKQLLPQIYTACVFFPSRRQGFLELKTFVSESSGVIPMANIGEGHGLVSLLLKNETSRILEGDVPSGRTLYYYQDDPSVRSVAAVPIIVRQRRRGCILVDSRQANAFDQKTITVLKSMAIVLGTLAFKSYVNLENYTQKEQLRSLYHYQRKFFHTMSVKDIYSHVADYIKGALPYDRLLILAQDVNNKGKGRVALADGVDQDFFINLGFSMEEKGLLQLAFTKRIVIMRSFNPDEPVIRINDQEKPNYKFRSLLAVPVIAEQDQVDMVIAVESLKHRSYSELHQDLLTSVANAAGFALGRTRAYEEKQELASRDGLTGLVNHRTFHDKLRVEKLRSDRMGHCLGIVMLDIDHFKAINDTYGHPAGDAILRNLSILLQKEIRLEVDVVARYGGEEFIIMLLDSHGEGLAETAERIRRTVELREFDIGRMEPLHITVSVGTYLLRPDFRDTKKALAYADEALYKAKATGRNKVVGYT